MSIQVVHSLQQPAWRRFVDEHPQGNIFHTPEMFQVFERSKGQQPSLWAAVDPANCPLALLLPAQVALTRGVLRRFTTRAVVYGSVLCASRQESMEALRLLLETYNRETRGKILFTELRNLSGLSDLQPVLNDCGFIYEDHLNYLVDLTRPPEEIWKSIRSNARRNVRRARKAKVAIQEVHDVHQIAEVYLLLKKIYHRIQVPLADVSFFQSSFEILHPRGMMRIFLARLDGVDLAVMTLLLYKDTIIYWYSGTLREHAAYRPGDFLVWHALQWGSNNGFRVLDFGGAGKPSEEYGVRDFKAKFGGELVNYGRNVSVHAPVALQIGKVGYRVARRFLWGKGNPQGSSEDGAHPSTAS